MAAPTSRPPLRRCGRRRRRASLRASACSNVRASSSSSARDPKPSRWRLWSRRCASTTRSTCGCWRRANIRNCCARRSPASACGQTSSCRPPRRTQRRRTAPRWPRRCGRRSLLRRRTSLSCKGIRPASPRPPRLPTASASPSRTSKPGCAAATSCGRSPKSRTASTSRRSRRCTSRRRRWRGPTCCAKASTRRRSTSPATRRSTRCTPSSRAWGRHRRAPTVGARCWSPPTAARASVRRCWPSARRSVGSQPAVTSRSCGRCIPTRPCTVRCAPPSPGSRT